MKIYIPAFNPTLRVNEHLAHGEFEIDLGKDVVKVVRCKDCGHIRRRIDRFSAAALLVE